MQSPLLGKAGAKMTTNVPVDIDKPRWDQGTFYGRFQHFLRVTNPLLSLKSDKDLERAAQLVSQVR